MSNHPTITNAPTTNIHTGSFTDYYATPDTWRTHQSTMRVIQALNSSFFGRSQNAIYGDGYLTTFSALILKGSTAFIFHVGDTRIYRLRGEDLECLTRDHTQRIDRTTNYFSRAVGADPYLEVDMHTREINVGDIFVLSCDSIHEFNPAAEKPARHQTSFL